MGGGNYYFFDGYKNIRMWYLCKINWNIFFWKKLFSSLLFEGVPCIICIFFPFWEKERKKNRVGKKYKDLWFLFLFKKKQETVLKKNIKLANALGRVQLHNLLVCLKYCLAFRVARSTQIRKFKFKKNMKPLLECLAAKPRYQIGVGINCLITIEYWQSQIIIWSVTGRLQKGCT